MMLRTVPKSSFLVNLVMVILKELISDGTLCQFMEAIEDAVDDHKEKVWELKDAHRHELSLQIPTRTPRAPYMMTYNCGTVL
jgi:hypothetical protein